MAKETPNKKWSEERKKAHSERMKAIQAQKRDQKLRKSKPRHNRYPQGEFAYYKFFNELDPGVEFWGRYQGVEYSCDHGGTIRIPIEYAEELNAIRVPSDTPKRVKIDPDLYQQGTPIPSHVVSQQPRFTFTKIRPDDE